MNMKKFPLPETSSSKAIALAAGMSVLSYVVAIFYGPLRMENPFWVLSLFFTFRLFIFLVTDNYEGQKNEELKRAVTFGSLKLLTLAVIIACTMPQQNFLLLLIPVVVISLVFSAGKDIITVGLFFFNRHREQKEFNRSMKEVAETARREEALSEDLLNFLIGTDPTGKQKT